MTGEPTKEFLLKLKGKSIYEVSVGLMDLKGLNFFNDFSTERESENNKLFFFLISDMIKSNINCLSFCSKN